ncbi:hypothetical protein U9R90_00335 [Streptomyces sp. E11-3]|uniref:hypothetical protein n=1 Tax=Streptomyces sp. E11-3 TaxID=3110112 RepID=UPI00397F555C
MNDGATREDSPLPTSRWFISAPAATDLRTLLRELKRRGVDPYVLSDVAPLGASIAQSLRQAIAQAETVLVVLGNPDQSQSTLFEAGVAVGMGKRVIVIADPDQDTSPDLDGLLTIRARPDDVEAVAYALAQAEGRLVRVTPATSAAEHALGSTQVNELLELLRKQPMRLERTAVDVLKAALEGSGAVAVKNPDPKVGDRLDLGVWSDDLGAIALNPLLIEVKRTLSRSAVEQTLHLLQRSRMNAALLVYLDPPTNAEFHEALRVPSFPVLTISLETLLERMRASSFAEVVRDLRNRAVHGRASS